MFKQQEHLADDKTLMDRQVKVAFEDCSTLDVKSYEPKTFTVFEEECRTYSLNNNVKAYIEYSGTHAQGEKQGYGCELSQSCDFYCGGWLKGLRHGSGICFYKDGGVYKGSWCEGQWCIANGTSGVGMYKNPKGEIIIGTFTKEKGQLKDLQWA